MPLRIVFMGTPEYSEPTLTALVEAGHDVVAVYSQPPRPSGRGMGERKSAVHARADQLAIPVLTPTSLKKEPEQLAFAAHNADIAVVVAYGLILPQIVLDAPRLGCINGHASLLPRWRGAAPIQRAIEAGDTQSGVMIMQMEAGLDTGPVLLESTVPIDDQMTAGQLHDQLAALTGTLMVDTLAKLETGIITPTPQSEDGLQYAKKIEKSETRINWNQPAQSVHNHIRAMSPFPGAWCEMGFSGRTTRVKILESEVVDGAGDPGQILDENLTIACAQGAMRPTRLQKAGKQPSSLSEFLRGNSIAKNTILS